MSASNWEICPKCCNEAYEAADKNYASVYSQYGKVSIEEFDILRKTIVPIDREKYRTFREDYEIYGAEDGKVTVDYEGSCEECGLSVSFTHKVPFWPES